jgi:hypothetical protein
MQQCERIGPELCRLCSLEPGKQYIPGKLNSSQYFRHFGGDHLDHCWKRGVRASHLQWGQVHGFVRWTATTDRQL